MTFTKILCPTDFSPGAHQALQVAARMAAASGAELVVLHSCYIPPTAYTMDGPFPAYITQNLMDDSQIGLDAAVRDATAAGAKHVSGKLLTGPPWAEIVDVLEKQAFDLCVIGTHGRTGLARIFLGSVAEKVIRHSPCSVLAVRPDGHPESYGRILVPTDFSKSAEHAMTLAASLVAPGGSIMLLHVIEAPIGYSSQVEFAEFGRDLDKRSAAALEAAAARLQAKTSAPINVRVHLGYAGARILAAIDDDRKIDLVVMGSHGRTGIKRALLGSVAEKVVRHARCPVLVARERE